MSVRGPNQLHIDHCQIVIVHCKLDDCNLGALLCCLCPLQPNKQRLQSLIYAGEVMKDGHNLADYGVPPVTLCLKD